MHGYYSVFLEKNIEVCFPWQKRNFITPLHFNGRGEKK
jgi:hypothetical protein